MQAAVLVFEAGRDPGPALAWLRQLLPDLQRLQVLVWASVESGWWADPRWRRAASRLEEGEADLARLQAQVTGWPRQLHGDIVVELGAETLREAIEAVQADVVAWGPLGEAGNGLAGRLLEPVAIAHRLPQLLIGPAAGLPRPLRSVACPYLGSLRQLAPLGPLLARLGEPGRPTVHLLQLRPHGPAGPDPVAFGQVSGLGTDLSHERLEGSLLDLAEATRAWLQAQAPDLVAVALPATATLDTLFLPVLARRAPATLPAPLLVIPGPSEGSDLAPLASTDLLRRAGHPLRLRVEAADRLGGPQPFNGPLALVSGGEVLGIVEVRDGVALLPALPPELTAIGLADPADPTHVRVGGVRVESPTWIDLVQAHLPPPELARAAAGLAPTADRRRVVVRLSANQRLDSLRRSLAEAGLADALLLDAALELQDGAGTDLNARVDAVRLVRLARHLQADGLTVDRVAMAAAEGLIGPGLALWTVPGAAPPPPPRPEHRVPIARTTSERLARLCASEPQGGNEVSVELDNAQARQRWLALVEGATRSVHVQTYMFEDDAVAGRLAAALAAAAGRGVAVRILVDSVFSRYGSLGGHNPLLTRLATAPGIALLQFAPVHGLPGLTDLKLRSHRKLLVVDGQAAVVSGRNLGATYLTGFDEVLVTPSTPGMTIPWLDAGAHLRGPIVREVEAAFLAAWVQAGGSPFELPPPGPAAGPSAVQLILHEGLRDTHTLDAYRSLIDGARQALSVVNTFPLQHELQQALLRALERGVFVRCLVGNVRPVHGARVAFPDAATAREVATQVIHGRLDSLARAGATVAEVAFAHLPGWDPAQGPVRPHVHAKLLVADGRFTAVGSANLDVTAGYWESEVLAVVDCVETAGRVEATLDALLATAVPFDTTDPTWQVLAGRRAWLSANWPSLVG